jgi:hypothetical protein
LSRECASPEWLGMSHISALGACFTQTYFDERPIFGKEDLILEYVQQVTRKKHAKKKEKQHAR